MITIIRLTFLEMRKKKILYLTLALTAAFLLLYGLGAKYSYKSLSNLDAIYRMAVIQQILSMGIYAAGFIIAFLSIFSSIGAISSELEQGTYDAILSKPIARYEIILGRFIGILSFLIPYVTFLYLSVVGLNIFFGKAVGGVLNIEAIVKSLLVLYLLPILLVSVGIFLSTSMSTMGSGVTAVILYFCGMIGGIVEQMGHFMTDVATKSILTNIGIITSLIIPSDIVYRKSSSLLFTSSSGLNLSVENMIGGAIQPSPFMMGYIVFYSMIVLMFAVRKFQNRDL